MEYKSTPVRLIKARDGQSQYFHVKCSFFTCGNSPVIPMLLPNELQVEGISKLGVLPQISNGSKIINPPPILCAENAYSMSPYSKLVIQVMIKDKNILYIFI